MAGRAPNPHWDIRDWLRGDPVAGCLGCPRDVFFRLPRHDQEVLIFKYGLAQLGGVINFSVRDILRSNQEMAEQFGLNNRQTAFNHLTIAMQRLIWACNGVKMPAALAIFMHTNPDGSFPQRAQAGEPAEM